MKTATQIKKEARERFDEFVGWTNSEQSEGKAFAYFLEHPDKVKNFLDQLIDDTIKQTLEGVGEIANNTMVNVNSNVDTRVDTRTMEYKHYLIKKGWNDGIKEFLTKLAKEIEG